MRRIQRNERGHLLAVGAVVLIVFGGLVGIGVNAAQESVARTEQPVVLVAVQYANVTVHPPSGTAFQRECISKVALRYTLTYTDANGWRATDTPRPDLSNSNSAAAIARDTQLKADWEERVTARVNLAHQEWTTKCMQADKEGGGGPIIEEPDPRTILQGRWYITRNTADPFAGQPNYECPLPQYVDIAFNDGTAPIATVTFAGKLPEKAEQIDKYSYEHQAGNTQNGLRFTVGVVRSAGNDILSGSYHDNGRTYICTVPFDGKRSPN